jgi:hypothetical protein
MSKEVVDCIKRHWFEPASMLVSIFLLVAGFFMPPQGVIDGSVLMGIGEIIAGAAILSFLSNLPEYIKAGASAKLSKGDLNLELQGKKKEEENTNE